MIFKLPDLFQQNWSIENLRIDEKYIWSPDFCGFPEWQSDCIGAIQWERFIPHAKFIEP